MQQAAKITVMLLALLPIGTITTATIAEARSCSQLRALCWTMRDDKSDCAAPYRQCLKSGVFITPLGRVFKATSRD